MRVLNSRPWPWKHGQARCAHSVLEYWGSRWRFGLQWDLLRFWGPCLGCLSFWWLLVRAASGAPRPSRSSAKHQQPDGSAAQSPWLTYQQQKRKQGPQPIAYLCKQLIRRPVLRTLTSVFLSLPTFL